MHALLWIQYKKETYFFFRRYVNMKHFFLQNMHVALFLENNASHVSKQMKEDITIF